jgi:transposase
LGSDIIDSQQNLDSTICRIDDLVMNTNAESIYLTPFQRQMLEENLQQELPSSYRQRLEIILLTDRGRSQAEICRTLGCCTATASRWIQLTKAGLAHKYLDCPVGRPKIVTDEYIELLRTLLQHSPRNYGYPFKNWTVNWLSKHIAKEMGIEVSESHLKRVMGELGLSTRTKAQPDRSRQSNANIFIADLQTDLERLTVCDSNRSNGELSELNFSQLKWDAQIHGAANSFAAYFTTATQRDLRYCAQFHRI